MLQIFIVCIQDHACLVYFLFIIGYYQDQDNSTTCKQVPSGYYQNEFGSDNVNTSHKGCPRGFICQEANLPKYYQVCKV